MTSRGLAGSNLGDSRSQMASASDVRAILSLPASAPGTSQPRKPTATASRKPDGISRELYSLIGDSAPTLVAQYARPKFKPKLDLGRSKARWCAPRLMRALYAGSMVLNTGLGGHSRILLVPTL